MASSRKRRSADVSAAVRRALPELQGKRVLVALSGGVDSVVLLHALRAESGMRGRAKLDGRVLARPLLDVPREAIVAYAHEHELQWIEDESNRSEALARNFIRLRIAPLLAERYPRWREALARAARHFARSDADAAQALRAFLAARGLRGPSEPKLVRVTRRP